MNKFATALTVLLFSLGAAAADELHVGVITKVEGDKITMTLFKGKNANTFLQETGEFKGDSVVYVTLENVKVAKASFDPAAKKPKTTKKKKKISPDLPQVDAAVAGTE